MLFLGLQVQTYSKVSPNAHLAIAQPADIVSTTCRSLLANSGLHSTTSRATRLPVSATLSAMKRPSLKVKPPLTGVPVAGTNSGSMASTS